jgi:hypothetical protein
MYEGSMTGISLPVMDAPPPVPEDGHHKILVVDDEAGIRRGCQRVLATEGHEVLVAHSVAQALEVVGLAAADSILTTCLNDFPQFHWPMLRSATLSSFPVRKERIPAV